MERAADAQSFPGEIEYSVDDSQRNRHTMYTSPSPAVVDAVESPLYRETIAPTRGSVPMQWPSSMPHARFQADQPSDALRARKVDTFGALPTPHLPEAVQAPAWATGSRPIRESNRIGTGLGLTEQSTATF